MQGCLAFLGGVPRQQKMPKAHLPRVLYHQVFSYTKIHVVLIDAAWHRCSRLLKTVLSEFGQVSRLEGYLTHNKTPTPPGPLV